MASTPFQDFPATNSQWLIGQVFLFGVGPSESAAMTETGWETLWKQFRSSKKNCKKKMDCLGLVLVSMVSIVLSHVAIIASPSASPGRRGPAPWGPHTAALGGVSACICVAQKNTSSWFFFVLDENHKSTLNQIPWCNTYMRGVENDLISSW